MHFHLIRLIRFAIISIFFLIVFYSSVQISKESKTLPKTTLSKSTNELFIDDFDEISSILEPYQMFLPNFVNNQSRNWFLNSVYYRMYSSQCPKNSCETNGFLFDNLKEHRQIRLSFVKNGLYLNDDCGYNYDDQAVRRQFKSINETSIIYNKAIIYTVPDGWSFQHFLDGIGPKLSHSYRYLSKYPDAKVVIQHGIRFDQSVKQIWVLLNVKESDRLVHYQSGTRLGAHLLINPCRTAATHPKLWQDARRLYWYIANLTELNRSISRNKLIYLQRTSTNSQNQGRFILNDELFIKILQEYSNRTSLEFIQYDHSKQDNSIRKQIQLFSQARIIIGVHGGALSNMNFAQSGTIIIEIMPYRSEQSTVPVVCRLSYSNELKPCVGFIYYVQSQLLNHSYWILPTSVNQQNNLHVDLNQIQQLFDSLPHNI